jgi:hypothetical protein
MRHCHIIEYRVILIALMHLTFLLRAFGLGVAACCGAENRRVDCWGLFAFVVDTGLLLEIH